MTQALQALAPLILPLRPKSTPPRLQAALPGLCNLDTLTPESRHSALRRSPSVAALSVPAPGPHPALPEYVTQARRGMAFLDTVDALNAREALGHFTVSFTTEGGIVTPRVTSQRLDCYMGTLEAYTRYLNLLSDPRIRLDFVHNNGPATLAEAVPGVAAGIVHAVLEIQQVFTRVSLIASNQASEADPLYAQIASACEPVNAEAQRLGMNAQTVWSEWALQGRAQINALPLVQNALTLLNG